jgi:uncharacterized protein DUF3300
VLDAVQVMRRRAQDAGTLRTTPQQTVTTQGQTIVIELADSRVVYVPAYDPWTIYGPPIAVYPGWEGVFVGRSGIYFGVGVRLGWFGGFACGWDHWHADWRGRRIFYDVRPRAFRARVFAPRIRADFHGFRGGFGHRR